MNNFLYIDYILNGRIRSYIRRDTWTYDHTKGKLIITFKMRCYRRQVGITYSRRLQTTLWNITLDTWAASVIARCRKHQWVGNTVEPLLYDPPSESHWCGRIRGMVVREGLDYFPGCTCLTCAPRNTRIGPIYGNAQHYRPHWKWLSGLHTAENAATKPLQCFLYVRTLAVNTERRRPTLAAFPKIRIQKTSFKINIDIHASLAVVAFVLFPIYALPFATSWI